MVRPLYHFSSVDFWRQRVTNMIPLALKLIDPASTFLPLLVDSMGFFLCSKAADQHTQNLDPFQKWEVITEWNNDHFMPAFKYCHDTLSYLT